MSIYEASPSPWPGRMLGVLRIVAGLVFISAGTMKLFGFPPSPMPNMPPIPVLSQLWIGGVLETVGGTAIVLGLFTRPVAFVLAGEMAVAYFQFHFPLSIFPTTNNGVPAVLYAFLFLYFTVAGAGPWSIDALLARSGRGGNARLTDASSSPQAA
ncbi:MAG: DoxX family protein [Gemmatimonadaceae bacterium]|nr:DoxX family protein [Gemmatimonadaceae bacterium]